MVLMANSIFKDGGGAGIGSYVVVFKNGELAPETSLLKLRRAYEAGESIFFSVIDIETKDALVPASGWIDEEGKLHLVARDFDDAKTYSLVFDANPIESEIDVHAEVKDGIDLAGEDIPSWDQIESALAEKADLVDGKIPAEELPSYVDDVEEYEDLEHFPTEGEQGKIYVASDTGLTYRWSGTQYIQIGGSDLSAGDGINIADHIVSADMEYLNEHLNFVAPDEVENDIEVIGYQNQTPISEEQLEKAVAGKLVIKHNNRLYVKHFQTADMINFHTFEIGRNIGTSVTVNTTLRSMEYVIILLRSTRMLSDSGAMPVSAVGDDGDNFLAAGTAPAADGKKVIRELNLQPALEGKADRAALESKADKPLNTMQFNVPEGWSGDMYALLMAQDAERFEKWIGAAYEFGNYCIYDQLGNYYEFLGVDENHARILIKLNQGDASNDDGILALISGGVAIQDEGGDPQLMVGNLFPINYRLMPVDTLKLNVPEEITHLPHEWTESDLELVLGAIAPREAVRINEAATANGSTQFYDQFEHHYLIVPSDEYWIWYVSLATDYSYGNRISRSAYPQFYAFAVEAEARTETGSVTVTSLGDAHYATDRDLASKQDTLVSGTNIKTINGNSVLGEGDLVISGGADPMQNILYADLVALRDSAQLIPGMQYRITDYVCMTAAERTHSAGHVFDIIVVADDDHTLNKKARAALHEGDEYFANSNLAAWQLWYDLDNDQAKHEWADPVNGKGVIYRMIDEFNNDLPYDFKNIVYEEGPSFVYERSDSESDSGTRQSGNATTFIRCRYLDDGDYYAWRTAAMPSGWHYSYCFTLVETPTTDMVLYEGSDGTEVPPGGSITEVSVELQNRYTFDLEGSDGSLSLANNNLIGPYDVKLNRIIFNMVPDFFVFNNVFGIECHDDIFASPCFDNVFGRNYSQNMHDRDFCNNKFGNECCDNAFGEQCSENIFDGDCYGIVFGSWCAQNVIHDQCEGIVLGNQCNQNVFDANSSYNVLGDYCYSNVFRFQNTNNTLGNHCSYNDFAQSHDNVLGDSCTNDSFDINCHDITLGEQCTYDVFGKDCSENTLSSGCAHNTFGAECAGNSITDGGFNTFGYKCENNVLGESSSLNTLGSECNGVTIGSFCHENVFGKNCEEIQVNDHCIANRFGNGCGAIVLGNACEGNVFSDRCGGIDIQGFTLFNSTFDSECRFLSIVCDVADAEVSNRNFHKGLQGTRQQLLTITVQEDPEDINHVTDYYAAGSKEIILGGN